MGLPWGVAHESDLADFRRCGALIALVRMLVRCALIGLPRVLVPSRIVAVRLFAEAWRLPMAATVLLMTAAVLLAAPVLLLAAARLLLPTTVLLLAARLLRAMVLRGRAI